MEYGVQLYSVRDITEKDMEKALKAVSDIGYRFVEFAGFFGHPASEIKAMLAEGKTQREVAEYYGFRDKQVVKRLLERERRKERKLAAGILPRPKGRPRKDTAPRNIVAEQAYEIQRLQMENKLLRDFLRSTERK